MKHFVITLAASAIMMTSVMAQKVGVSMAYFDDLFLTNLRAAMTAQAKETGVKLQYEDAQGDIGKQLSQIQNFIAQKVDAIVVNPVDSSATPKMTKLVTACRHSSGLRQPRALRENPARQGRLRRLRRARIRQAPG